MNKGGFSWKRAVGITRVKSRISRATGIPLTKGGRQRKLGKYGHWGWMPFYDCGRCCNSRSHHCCCRTAYLNTSSDQHLCAQYCAGEGKPDVGC
mgnify:CR=1 FL=1